MYGGSHLPPAGPLCLLLWPLHLGFPANTPDGWRESWARLGWPWAGSTCATEPVRSQVPRRCCPRPAESEPRGQCPALTGPAGASVSCLCLETTDSGITEGEPNFESRDFESREPLEASSPNPLVWQSRFPLISAFKSQGFQQLLVLLSENMSSIRVAGESTLSQAQEWGHCIPPPRAPSVSMGLDTCFSPV